jgi:hypothetical protein
MTADQMQFSIDPIPGGAVTITLPTDAWISLQFVDSADQQTVLADYTGTKRVKVSTLLNSLPAKRWLQILNYIVPILAAERAGIQEPPTDG